MLSITQNPAELLVLFISLVLSIGIHEFAHVFSAYLQGDQTGRLMGRLTLNPLKHLDPIGTIFMIIALLSGMGIGWGKPAPYNPNNLRHHRWGPFLVAIAGPLSNVVLVAIFGYAAVLFSNILPSGNLLMTFLVAMATVNAMLAVFNLIPIPPLDGSSLLGAVFGPQNPVVVLLNRYGFVIILGVIFLLPNLISIWVSTGADLIFRGLGLV